MLDPIATGKSVAEIINLFVDDLFGTGGKEKNGTMRSDQTEKGFPSWLRGLE